jgi:hypothetical protein
MTLDQLDKLLTVAGKFTTIFLSLGGLGGLVHTCLQFRRLNKTLEIHVKHNGKEKVPKEKVPKA